VRVYLAWHRGAADLGKRSGAAYPVYVSRADRPKMWCCWTVTPATHTLPTMRAGLWQWACSVRVTGRFSPEDEKNGLAIEPRGGI